VLIVLKSGSFKLPEPYEPVQTCNGIDLPLPFIDLNHGQEDPDLDSRCSQTYFWLKKIITDSLILAYVNIESPDDRYEKLRIYISEPISDSYEVPRMLCNQSSC
jgi:hypothetical protein